MHVTRLQKETTSANKYKTSTTSLTPTTKGAEDSFRLCHLQAFNSKMLARNLSTENEIFDFLLLLFRLSTEQLTKVSNKTRRGKQLL